MHAQIHVSLPFSKQSRITQHLNNLDNDECSQDSHACHGNATCINSPGSYLCYCKSGYSGNGQNCTGT